jgi:hypothetical protein
MPTSSDSCPTLGKPTQLAWCAFESILADTKPTKIAYFVRKYIWNVCVPWSSSVASICLQLSTNSLIMHFSAFLSSLYLPWRVGWKQKRNSFRDILAVEFSRGSVCENTCSQIEKYYQWYVTIENSTYAGKSKFSSILSNLASWIT